MKLGIDLGGTKIEGIALDGSHERARARVRTPRDDYGATLTAIATLVSELERTAGTADTVGVGIPGTISRSTGLVKNANSVWLIGRPLQQDLERILGREVRIANDANCFAVSEAADGAAAGADVVFGVIVGTGTGAGIVVGHRVMTGPHGIAGEWGHNPLPWPEPDEWPGPACYCGRTGCIETFLSGPGLVADFARTTAGLGGPSLAAGPLRGTRPTAATTPLDGTRLTAATGALDGTRASLVNPEATGTSTESTGGRVARSGAAGIAPQAEDIVALAERGDATAEAALVRYERRMARALASIINILDPDVIVLGGGMSNIARLYESVPRYWSDFVFAGGPAERIRTPLVRARHGDASGVRGAAWLWNDGR